MGFQHDGVLAHFSADVRSALNTAYPGRWIGRGGLVNWLARSPGLLPQGPYEESSLRKPRRLRRGPDCEDCLRSRRTVFCDSARKSYVYHFLRVIIHSTFIELFLFILSREVTHVYYE
ncbi:uncharacterized protein TNCV_2981831 [Trichonephila clavipes]|nr:uncharacterized protein TNCV_2981831 [Trichonephila clavipes]